MVAPRRATRRGTARGAPSGDHDAGCSHPHTAAWRPSVPPLARLLRLRDVLRRRSVSRSLVYASIAAGTFPPLLKLGRRTCAWSEHEIEAIDRARLASASDEALRQLVAALLCARQVPAQISLALA